MTEFRAPETTDRTRADWVAPDCRGQNFYDLDPAFAAIIGQYMEPELHRHLVPHLRRLGELAGGRLDELARTADRHQPILHHRDRYGRDEDWIEYHPAYREMEKIAFEEFGMNRLTRRPGVLGWPKPMGSLARYGLQYLFAQAEFGLMCPINLAETTGLMIERYAPPAIRGRYLSRLWADNCEELLRGAQFMTEQAGGSDVANSEVAARKDGEVWRIVGDKWFCSCADGDVILLLARTDAGGPGSRGLSLFLVPRRLEDGSRNAYRIVRLKEKLGSRSMASGEVKFEGAVAYLMGEEGRGLKQMMDQVNLSRLSHGVRAAGMMRRCLNEALAVARSRVTFGRVLGEHPLMQRQLMKMMVPTEQALSVMMFTAAVMERAETGDASAARLLRILTPILKFRACRDNVRVAQAAMEARGGNGYIEDWVNPKLVRDSLLGVLWEGTSSIISLDVTTRAIVKSQAHEALGAALHDALEEADGVPGQYRGELGAIVDQAVAFAAQVASNAENEPFSRQAASALYHATSAVLLAREGAQSAEKTGDARRLVLSRLVVEHRLRSRDPLAVPDAGRERQAAAVLLSEKPADLASVLKLAAA